MAKKTNNAGQVGMWVKRINGVRTAVFNGKTFQVFHGRTPGMLGGTTGESDAKPAVFLDDRLFGRQRIEVAIHEGLHAFFGSKLTEDEVTRAGKDISRFLMRLYEVESDEAVKERVDAEEISKRD